jgi:hypothetical protein
MATLSSAASAFCRPEEDPFLLLESCGKAIESGSSAFLAALGAGLTNAADPRESAVGWDQVTTN